MGEHERYAAMAVDRLKDVVGVLEILLFGSVSRGEARDDSDIDLAVIFSENVTRMFTTNSLSEFPIVVHSDIKKIKDEFEKIGSPRLDISLYYKDEYDAVVELGRDVLNDVGVVKYVAD